MWAGGIGITAFINKLKKRQSRSEGITEELQERLKRLTFLPQKTDEELLADYRIRFQRAPLGIWSATVGTASVVMDEVWEFLPDGTGSCQEYGCFGGVGDLTQFEWKAVGDFSLLCRVTKEAWEDYPGQDAENEKDELVENWHTIDYGFQVIQTDCGSHVAMCSVLNGVIQSYFWSSQFALLYSGPSKIVE